MRGEYLQDLGDEYHTQIYTKALTEMDYCQRVFSADVFSSISAKESLEIFNMDWNRTIWLLVVPIWL